MVRSTDNKSSRKKVEQILPSETVEALTRDLEEGGGPSPELCREIHERYGLQRDYGLSLRRVSNYLKRLWTSRSAVEGVDSRENFDPWPANLREHRARQSSVASILDATFGKLADSDPSMWGRRAYLILLGIVYERLATNEAEIETGELVSLARVIAESRKVEIRAAQSEKDEEKNASNRDGKANGQLPDNISEVIQQVYGTNFHAPDENTRNSKQL